jgi:hypothetical protein
LLAAGFTWIGIFNYHWKNYMSISLILMILAVGGSFLSVAQSGWQGTNFDRYLVWTTPFLLIFLAEGLSYISNHLYGKVDLPFLPLTICVIFTACMAFVSICRFNRSSFTSNLLYQFSHEVDKHIPRSAKVGSFGGSGIVYGLGQRPYTHLWGIYSPEFQVTTEAAALEILKNRPETRFDYWFLRPDIISAAFGHHVNECCSENVLTGPNGMEIRKTSWAAYDWARSPQAKIPQEQHLIGQVDIGYETDEKAANYEIIDRYGRPPTPPFLIVDKLNGHTAIDAARMLVGGDAMTIPLQTGKVVTVIMRTYPRHTEKRINTDGQNLYEYSFANPLRMNISIDGHLTEQISISYATNGFSDVSFTLPGTAIKQTPCRLAFLGDHIVASYWFYQ